MQRQRIAGTILALTGALGALTACGEDEKDGPEEPVVIEITFENGEVEPNGERVEVAAGQPVDLVVTADAPGTLHLHSDPEQELAFQAGEETFPIQIDRPGVVAVESHELDQVVVQLEVR